MNDSFCSLKKNCAELQVWKNILAKKSKLPLKKNNRLNNFILSVSSLINEGNFDAAINALTNFLEKDPNELLPNALIATAYASKGELQNAIYFYEKTTKISQNFLDGYYNAGVIRYNLQEFDLAIKHLEKVIQLRNDHIEARLLLSKCYRNTNDFFNSINVLQLDNSEVVKDIRLLMHAGDSYRHFGEYAKAIDSYIQVLNIEPNDENCLTNMAVCYFSLSQFEVSLTYFLRVINVSKGSADAFYNIGKTYAALKKHADAIENFKTAIRLDPLKSYIHLSLGNELMQIKNYDDALHHYHKVSELTSHSTDAHCNIGACYIELGNHQKAMKHLLLAKKYDLSNGKVYCNLGNLYKALREPVRAEKYYKYAISLNPGDPYPHYVLGNLYKENNDNKKAITHYLNTLEIDNSHFDALNNLALTYKECGETHQAIETLETVINTAPNFLPAYNNLATCLRDVEKLKESIQCLEHLLKLDGKFVDAWINLGNCHRDTAQPQRAISAYNEAISADRNNLAAHSNLLFQLCQDQGNLDLRLETLKSFSEAMSETINDEVKLNPSFRKSTEKLKVGFVSGDFKDHPVGFFLENLFKNIRKDEIELFAFSNSRQETAQTKVLKREVAVWRDIYAISDSEAAILINNYEIDVLVDLSGHTALNRLGIFKYRPAKFQITWLGYWSTTGLNEIDYIIGDKYVNPTDKIGYTEIIYELPETYICFAEPRYALNVTETPAKTNNYFTFGCFNNAAKVTVDVIECWAEILHNVPQSKLMMKGKGFATYQKDWIKHQFQRNGIGEKRLLLEPASDRESLLAAYNEVDIALDPFPYTGGTTTCEALWMGVPVITLKGDTFVQNIGTSILSNAGYSNFCCDSIMDYIFVATNLTKNLGVLNKERLERRYQVTKSPVFNGNLFSRNFEKMLKEITS